MDLALSLKLAYGTSAGWMYRIVLVSSEIACDEGDVADILHVLKSLLTSRCARSNKTNCGRPMSRPAAGRMPGSWRTQAALGIGLWPGLAAWTDRDDG